MPTTWPYAARVLNIIELVDLLSSADLTVKMINIMRTTITIIIPITISALLADFGGLYREKEKQQEKRKL
jgi:hypothetical protein